VKSKAGREIWQWDIPKVLSKVQVGDPWWGRDLKEIVRLGKYTVARPHPALSQVEVVSYLHLSDAPKVLSKTQVGWDPWWGRHLEEIACLGKFAVARPHPALSRVEVVSYLHLRDAPKVLSKAQVGWDPWWGGDLEEIVRVGKYAVSCPHPALSRVVVEDLILREQAAWVVSDLLWSPKKPRLCPKVSRA